ncbi:MAG: hypothetical protein JWP52_2506 [Rhizobacter sp.]|nr:hypothetical protein [Rhizobacter sp.]
MKLELQPKRIDAHFNRFMGRCALVVAMGSAMNFAQAQTPFLSVDPALMASRAEIQDWLQQKDSWGPAYTGSAAWKSFHTFLMQKILAYGMVDPVLYRFNYTRWYTSEYPDKSGWSLVSNGAPVNVASYATQSGSTGPNGVTGQMILYDLGLPVDQRPPLSALAGKILVIKQQPYSTARNRVPLGVSASPVPPVCGNPPYCGKVTPPELPVPQPAETTGGGGNSDISYWDYEYRSDDATYNLANFGDFIPTSIESSMRQRDQFKQSLGDVLSRVIIPSGALGHVIVTDMSPLAAIGLRQHSTPQQYNMPGLILDRVAGEQVLADAAAGKTATLKLDAHEEENADAYTVVAILPGKNYGTPLDQTILMATHTDGPSVVEDDGAMGIMATIAYYSKIPQAQRPRSIMVYLDTRHFVPGTESGYPFDYLEDNPQAGKTLMASLAMEHFGGLQYVENGNDYTTTGKAATTFIWGWANPLAIDLVTKVIKDNQMPRTINDAPGRPGIHGQQQASWKGSGFSELLIPFGGYVGWHVSGDWPSAGDQAFYPAVPARVDAGVFLKQVAGAVQLTGNLMTKDTIALDPDWGYVQQTILNLSNSAFINASAVAQSRATLMADFDSAFTNAKAGNYKAAYTALAALSVHNQNLLVGAPSTTLRGWNSKLMDKSRLALKWKSQGTLGDPWN